MTTRQRKLRALMKQWGGGEALAKKLGYSNSSYLSQMATGKRPITEKTVLHIEETLSLPRGWMDDEQALSPGDNGKAVYVNTALFAQCVAAVSERMGEMGVSLGVEKFEEVVGFIYEDATQRGQVSTELIARALRLAV